MAITNETALALVQLSGLVLTADDLETALTQVCTVATEALDACEGTSLTMQERGIPVGSAASDEWSRDLDRMQVEEQEGPCLDCLREGSVMRVLDFAEDGRFPSYGPRAAAAGARSVVSVPLSSDGRAVGALNLYSRRPRAFGSDEVGVAVLLAAHAVLAIKATTSFLSNRDLAAQLQRAMDTRAEIEQAKGILMAERRCPSDAAFEALVQLSQRTNRKLREVAHDLVERTGRGERPLDEE